MEYLFVAAVVAALFVLAVRFFTGMAQQRKVYLRAVADFRWHPDISPLQFEQHCADYLNQRGWNAKTTKGSGDQGVDVLATKAGIRVVIQCKKYSRPVGNKAVQEAYAAMSFAGAQSAAVVSNAAYTPGAKQLAEATGVLLLHFTDLARADNLFGIHSQAHGASTESVDASFFAQDCRVGVRCLKCRTTLRLPSGRSEMVTCPTCHTRFQTNT